MSRMTFINLPVKDLAKARAFFGSVGFSFDEQFTDENASRVIISDDASVMLEVEPFFGGFIAPQSVADTSASREVIVGLSADSREEVDDLVGKAVSAGAQELGDAQDDGFMYMRGFLDLDGHQWSFIHMDMAAIQG
jgi:predicted lactoylglutathione lyase